MVNCSISANISYMNIVAPKLHIPKMRHINVRCFFPYKTIPNRYFQIWTMCLKSSSTKTTKSKRYSDTLNLPKTSFPLSMKNGASAMREKQLQKSKQFQNLYSWQRKQNWQQEFVLHDGPPYANGKTHVGHAVNKVLKDITNRYKVMKKIKVHYIPGWDCHGMPIEQKAITDNTGQHQKLSPLEIRERARKYAKSQIKEQKKSFTRWGVMADWSRPYLTMDTDYQAKQLQVFYKIFAAGYVYRSYMPVYWSPSSGSALAEAELEYNPQHVSQAVYVTFPLTALPGSQLFSNEECLDVSAVVWTTTPWTIPFNQAICFNPDVKYAFLQCLSTSRVYLCEEIFSNQLSAIIDSDMKTLGYIDGRELVGGTYRHPMNGKQLPMLPGHHVLPGLGTGLVHTAPAHGHDDFQVAMKYDLPLECHVDAEGRYTSGVEDSLIGKCVGKDANQAVISMLTSNILQVSDFTHSYPYDWRTKQPIIIRASQQWFIDVSALRDTALNSLQSVKITPPQSQVGMMTQLQSRPYWCISRQRKWGVPIPVFYHKITGEPLLSEETVSHIIEVFKAQGVDSWWSLPIGELLPDDLLSQICRGQSSDYIKGEDILDIWFDSGVSWSSVLQNTGGQADLYLEGIDQFKGWFQTSLLTSVAARGSSPYRHIVTHGFATDEDGKKMSKSLGNVVDPHEVIEGGKDKSSSPSYGVDVLRWWVAHGHHHAQITVGPTILSGFNEDIFKVRKCVRYLLGNLYDFDPEVNCVDYHHLTAVDKYMLHVLHSTIQNIDSAYNSYSYHRVIQHIEKFVYSDLSSFYINITRDRCYCSGTDDLKRRACQTVQYFILATLTSAIAPVLPHLAEEIFQYVPRPSDSVDSASIFHQGWCDPHPAWSNTTAADTLMPVFDIRRDLMEHIGKENSVEFDVAIFADSALFAKLKHLQSSPSSSTSSLCEILQTSQVFLHEHSPKYNSLPNSTSGDVTIIHGNSLRSQSERDADSMNYTLHLTPASLRLCERCRRYTATSINPCDRCMSSLANAWAL